jgi:hypothetical protein
MSTISDTNYDFDFDLEQTQEIDKPKEPEVSSSTVKRNWKSCYVCGKGFTNDQWMKDIYYNNNTEAIRVHLFCFDAWVKER